MLRIASSSRICNWVYFTDPPLPKPNPSWFPPRSLSLLPFAEEYVLFSLVEFNWNLSLPDFCFSGGRRKPMEDFFSPRWLKLMKAEPIFQSEPLPFWTYLPMFFSRGRKRQLEVGKLKNPLSSLVVKGIISLFVLFGELNPLEAEQIPRIVPLFTCLLLWASNCFPLTRQQ